MRHYLLVTLSIVLLMVITATYAWQTPEETTPHLARLSNAKPTLSTAAVQADSEVVADASPTVVQIDRQPVADSAVVGLSELTDPLLKPQLPEQFDEIEAAAEVDANTEIGAISFSTDITGDYRAVDPGKRFGQGYFTLYATFSYEDMVDGTTWSWVWRHNGQVIDGGNQRWTYGNDGPGYVYLRPEDGFDQGEYDLEVWVNGDKMAQSSFQVTDSISASN